jgi:hypothetical protein
MSTSTDTASALATDSGGSGLASTVTWSTAPGATTFADVASGSYTLTVSDNVGNQAKILIYVDHTAQTIPLYVTYPTSWTVSGLTITSMTAKCKSYKCTDSSSNVDPYDSSNANLTSISGLTADTYTLALWDANSYAGNSISLPFTLASGLVSSCKVSGVAAIDTRLSPELVISTIRKKAISEKLLNHDSNGSNLVSWTSPKLTVDTVSLVKNTAPSTVQSAAETVHQDDTSIIAFSTLSSRHAQALAFARSQFVASQNTDAVQNGADKKISPEITNNVKQDDSGRGDGVLYNQEYVRLACSVMAPLAEQFLAQHGVQLGDLSDAVASGGTAQVASPQSSGLHDAGLSNGLPSGPGIGMLCQPKDFWVFRREQGIGMVS